MASPKLKNLYFSLTASLYAFIILSLPANAETSITNVDFGKWKLVINASIALNLNPGYINISVHPLISLNLSSILYYNLSIKKSSYELIEF